MSCYLDTNIVVSLLFPEISTKAVLDWIVEAEGPIFVSDWLEIEFAALINRRVGSRQLSSADAASSFADFGEFVGKHVVRLSMTPKIGACARAFARDAGLKLSAADALHLAFAVEGSHSLITNDARLANAAVAIGCAARTP